MNKRFRLAILGRNHHKKAPFDCNRKMILSMHAGCCLHAIMRVWGWQMIRKRMLQVKAFPDSCLLSCWVAPLLTLLIDIGNIHKPIRAHSFVRFAHTGGGWGRRWLMFSDGSWNPNLVLPRESSFAQVTKFENVPAAQESRHPDLPEEVTIVFV